MLRYRFVIFQSPFHRGNGCNKSGEKCKTTPNSSFSPLFIGAMVVTAVWRVWVCASGLDFQSPFHRGNGCNTTNSVVALGEIGTFSPLFIGAMVVTVSEEQIREIVEEAFSPLFIGAMVVTQRHPPRPWRLTSFQSPFHRGNGCNTQLLTDSHPDFPFQSPFHRGNGCNGVFA